jgi:hypothetical protein
MALMYVGARWMTCAFGSVVEAQLLAGLKALPAATNEESGE